MKRIFVYEHLSGGGALGDAQASGGDLLAMGQAMRDAVASDLITLEDYDVSVATCSLASPVPTGATAVSPQALETAFDFVARVADAQHFVWVIAPETDGLLAQFQRGIDPARWLGCDGPAIKLASGKRCTLMALTEAGITTPLAFEHEPETTRWVVKPDDGAGAQDTQLHTSLEAASDDWSQRSRAGRPMAIEAWVEGAALSLSLLCGPAHTELLCVNRQHLRVDAAGALSYEGVELNVLPLARQRRAVKGTGPQAAALQALATRVGQSLPGLRGFVGIDLVWHAQRGPVVIEVNPRVTCAYVGLSQALGRNLAADVIKACGRPSKPARPAHA
jgi:tyramine---L-glutamate ligase